MTVSRIAFLGAMGVLALVVLNKITPKHAMMIGGGLVAIGFLTQSQEQTT